MPLARFKVKSILISVHHVILFNLSISMRGRGIREVMKINIYTVKYKHQMSEIQQKYYKM